MTQGTASFKYEVEKNSTGMTGVAGIPMYMDLIERIGLGKIIEEKVKVREGTQDGNVPAGYEQLRVFK